LTRAVDESPHPELEFWLQLALKFGSPDVEPRIDGDALLVPEVRVRSDGSRNIEWQSVRSREELLKALGFGPVFD
jgi:hypothetical protein